MTQCIPRPKQKAKISIECELDKLIRVSDIIPILEEYADLRGTEFLDTRKPTHGSCCTCQDCGHDHDSCVCNHNEILDAIIKIKSARPIAKR